MALVDEMAPTGYGRSLWQWIVEQNARRLFRSKGYADAFAAAQRRIDRNSA